MFILKKSSFVQIKADYELKSTKHLKVNFDQQKKTNNLDRWFLDTCGLDLTFY